MDKQALTINTLAATVITPSEVSQFSLDDVAPNSSSGGGGGVPEGDYLTFDENNVVTGGRLDGITELWYTQYGNKKLKKWDIPMPKLQKAMYVFDNSSIEKWDVSLPSLTHCEFFMAKSQCKTWDADLPKLANQTDFFRDCDIKSFKGNLDSLQNGYDFFWNCDDITVFDSELPSLSDARDFADKSKFDKASTLRILNSIPAYSSGTHRMKLGIHINHQADDEVLAAIEAAESKGWTLTILWNGTATASAASTYGLRTHPIYARVVEKDGERILDWGHYVTDPTGYEEFRSVEEAQAHFGIEEAQL